MNRQPDEEVDRGAVVDGTFPESDPVFFFDTYPSITSWITLKVDLAVTFLAIRFHFLR